MTISPIIFVAALCAAGSTETLDDFAYRDTAAAKQAWHAVDGTPITMADADGKRLMKLEMKTGPGSPSRRVCIDRKAKLDLEGRSEFTLRVATDNPEATEYVSLYFRSGKGWYSMSSGFSRKGPQTLHFQKLKAQSEGDPTGWNKIDTIRISFWRSGPQGAVFLLDKLDAVEHDVAVVSPGNNVSDRKAAASAVRAIERLLAGGDIEFDRISETSVAGGGLGRRAVAILPYNPQPSEKTLDELEIFVRRGGKLFVCHSLLPRLGKLLGLKPDARQRRKQPADSDMLLSDRGAFLAHVVLGDDAQGKQKMLQDALGRLAPVVWKQVCQSRFEKIEQIGHCNSLSELADFVKANHIAPKALAELKTARRLLARAELQYRQKQYDKAAGSIDDAGEMLAHAYLASQPSPGVEARGWWCHAGEGPYPGNWDRAIRELSESGFNMVFPNMLWGGVAHYASDVLPRSKTYEKYGDQIAQCVAAGKKYGVEVHVWKVNHYLSHRTPKEFADKLRGEGRLQVSAHGEPKDWLCPSHPDNLKLEADSMVEIVKKYDVDGIHFDYIRYPDGDHCYCDGCRKRFEADSGKRVDNWPEDCYRGPRRDEYRDWRVRQITRLVATVHDRAKKVRDDIKISAAVFGSYPACRDSIGQDWASWAKSGYVDFLCPMDYTESNMGFRALIKNQQRLLDGSVPIYPGIGATTARPPLSADRVVGQVEITRSLGAGGFTIFNLNGPTLQKIGPGFALGAGRQEAVPPHRKR